MRTKTLFVFLAFLSFSLTACAGEGARIKPVGEPWSFGRVKQGETREKVFMIKNVGDEDLILENVKSCCGYNVADISSWEVKPNGVSRIKVGFDTDRKSPGKYVRKIILNSNDSKEPKLKILVSSYIIGRSDRPAWQERRAPHDLVPEITVEETQKKMAGGEDVKVVDVREKEEFIEKHITGALNLPRSEYSGKKDSSDDLLEGITRDTFLVMCCGSGTRSSYMARKFKEGGYNAFNLKGGVKAWQRKGYEITEGPKTPVSLSPIEINLEEAYEHYYTMFEGKVVWVDVRDEEDFKKEHIKSAINVPLHLLNEGLESLPREKSLVLYCYDPSCGESTAAAKILLRNGYKKGKIRVLNEGIAGWKEAGYPTEKGR